MANPEHVAELDGLDVLSVSLYRMGHVIAALGLLGAALALFTDAPDSARLALIGCVGGIALAAANVHIYMKAIRWVIPMSASVGVVLQVLSAEVPGEAGRVVWHAGLGFAFVALSGLALKERLCFRIPGLVMVPLFLATSLMPLLTDAPRYAGALLGIAGALMSVLAVAKMRQPTHFDIGDKSRYQI